MDEQVKDHELKEALDIIRVALADSEMRQVNGILVPWQSRAHSILKRFGVQP